MRKRLPLRGGHLAADHFCRSPRLVDEHEVLWPLTSSGGSRQQVLKTHETESRLGFPPSVAHPALTE